MKLLFTDRSDVHHTWGQLVFGAETAKKIAECEDPGFQVRCVRPQADGSSVVFGYAGKKHQAWKLYRAVTDDGLTFREVQVVLEKSAWRWAHVGTVTYSPDLDRYLCLKNAVVEGRSFEQYAYFSKNGTDWTEHPRNPVYLGGDRWGAMWSTAVQRFVVAQKGFVRVPRKPYNELGMDVRRVVTLRTSADGITWTPDAPSLYWHGGEQDEQGTWQRLGGPLVPAEFSILPDEADPPDLEFYARQPFPYGDRYFLLMLNYTGSFLPRGHHPVQANGHGESIDTEWWTSRDGLRWERPFRGTNALAGARAPVRSEPMVVGEQLMFHMGETVFGMLLDRLTYVSSRANAVFDTPQFEMPATALRLNACIAAPDNPRPTQAYVMAELIDELDRVVPGYERERCILQPPFDEVAFPLVWRSDSGATRMGTELSGGTAADAFHHASGQDLRAKRRGAGEPTEQEYLCPVLHRPVCYWEECRHWEEQLMRCGHSGHPESGIEERVHRWLRIGLRVRSLFRANADN